MIHIVSYVHSCPSVFVPYKIFVLEVWRQRATVRKCCHSEKFTVGSLDEEELN